MNRPAAIFPLFAGVVAVALHFLPAPADGLIWDRERILAGEWWRLGTGHWVHFSAQHLWLDLGAFALLGGSLMLLRESRLPALLLGGGLALGAALLLFAPGMEIYAGLSGINALLFGRLWRRAWSRCPGTAGERALLLGGLAVAAILCGAAGASPSWIDLDSGVVPSRTGHLIGLALGVFLPLVNRAGVKSSVVAPAGICPAPKSL